MKEQKKRVNILLYNIFRTGGVRILLEYAKRLNEAGFDVVVYHSLLPYKHYRKENIRKYFKKIREKIYFLSLRKEYLEKYNSISLKIKLIPYLSECFFKKNDYFIFSYWPIAYALQRSGFDKRKIIYLIQAYERWDADLELLDNTYKMGFINIVTSNFLKNLIKEKAGADSAVIHDGIDFSVFKPVNKKNKNTKIIDICFINYTVKFKGTEIILNALDKIYNKYKDAVNIYSMTNTVTEQKQDYIQYIFNPNDNEIAEIMSMCDIFISASSEEGFYLVPAEAMACDCLSLTTPVGAVPDYSSDGVSAVYFEPGNVNQLVEKLEYLLNNIDVLKTISHNGFKEIREKLSWDKSVNQLIKWIENN